MSIAPLADRLPGLPHARTPLVGRAAELTTARALLIDAAVPVLTMTGPGGVGKTRLALAVGHEVAGSFADGASFVDLSAIRDPALVLPAIAQALGVRTSGDRPLSEALSAVLRPRQLLLVLDNCEHVLDAVPEVASLLAACPSLQVLATSRAPLRLGGEQLLPVSPLALPDPGAAPPLADLREIGAVALFVARARAADPGFALAEGNAGVVAEVCRRLDGLPLAIELAAARLRALSVEALLALLTDRLRVLTGGPRDAPSRLRAMREAIIWSHDLLASDEQALFCRLAVFVGGFDAEAVAAVGSVESGEAVDWLTALADQSLIRRAIDLTGVARWEMLETIREFGLERLAASGEEAAVREAHARFFLDLAERAAAAWFQPYELWLPRLEAEYPNLRAALDWVEVHGDGETLACLCGALKLFWFGLGHLVEAEPRVRRALARSDLSATGRVTLLMVVGEIEITRGDGRLGAAFFDEAIALYRTLDDATGLALALYSRGGTAWGMGEFDRAEAVLAEALALFQTLGEANWVAATLGELSIAALLRGDLDRAAVLAEESLAGHRATGDHFHVATMLHVLGWVDLERGEDRQAAERLAEALDLNWADGFRAQLTWSLSFVAWLAARRGRPEAAARLFGVESALRAVVGFPVSAIERAHYEARVALAQAALTPHAFAAAWAAGEVLPLAEAVQEARRLATEFAQATVAPASCPAPAGSLLTPRELEVLRLVAEGATDREIAETLCISRRTVGHHVSAILAKLGVETRRSARAYALRQRLV